jgi:bifunctional oligoribonuclease and PAP phosphatase NrnA
MNQELKHIVWSDITPLRQQLENPGKRIAIMIHVNPDGDALGSSLGLLRLLEKLGHACSVISPNDYPEFLKWMPGTERVIIMESSPALAVETLQNADIIFAVDFNDLSRVKKLNEVVAASPAFKVLIDHHPNPDIMADCMLSDITSSSTAELVYRFIKEAGQSSRIDKDTASCLFVGIMTDTGCFSYNSSNRKTWEVVAELLDFGIEKDRLYYLTYDNYSADRLRLLGFSLNEKMEVFPEYRTGLIWLTRQDLFRYNFAVGDTEGFVNYPLSIRGIRFSALFIEKKDHVRISFRSKGNFAVNDFSRKYFNGGGHANASGGESYLSMEETVKRFKELLPGYKDQLADYEG